MTTLGTFLIELVAAGSATATEVAHLERLFDCIERCPAPAAIELRGELEKDGNSDLPLRDRALEMIVLLRPFDSSGRLH